MQLPNKITKYEESIFPTMTSILETIEKEPINIDQLYVKVRFKANGVQNFIDALDSLYPLKKIDINEGGQIYYVGRDI